MLKWVNSLACIYLETDFLIALCLQVDDLTPQVTTAAKIVFQDPTNQAAQEHFDLMKKRWMDNMERLRGLVDEAVDSSALIKAEGQLQATHSIPDSVHSST